MRVITRTRIVLALAIALATDAIQILLGPLGWTFFDEGMDVVAMVLISWIIGFHPLLLPTFVLEIFPVVDMAPTGSIRRRAGKLAEAVAGTCDASSPDEIRAHLGLSKKAFKRAVGRLLRQRAVEIDADGFVAIARRPSG